MDTSDLYWLPFRAVYKKLQAANRSSLSDLNELLNLNFQWLLNGLTKFGAPNDTSANALRSGGALKAPAWGPKRGISVDKHLVNSTAELSQLLTLDELQCHLLLKRWLKDNNVNVTPAPAPAAGSAAAAGGPAQAVLSGEVVQGVADYFAEERVYLAKCQQFIIMTSMDVVADASMSCRDVLKRLLDASWEATAFDSLAALLKPRRPAAATAGAKAAGGSGSSSTALALVPAGGAAGPAADGSHVVKPFDFDQRLHLHQLHERCELMCLLTQLYCGSDPSCSASSYALHSLANKDARDLDREEAAEAAAVTAAVAEVVGLRWPECSEERLQQLLQLLGEAVFVAGAGGAASAAGHRGGWAAGSTDSQAASMQQLGEALACSLILAALKPAQLLQRLSDAAAAAAAGGPLPRGITPFRQWRSIESALMQWRPVVPGCVLALLVVYAYNQLLASYRGAADALSQSIQEHALHAGGFAALAAPLASQEELSGSTLAGGLHRGLLLQGLSLMAAAFDLSPWRLPGAVLQQVVELIVDVVQDCPHLAQQVWDESLPSTRPLRHFLDEACALFPAYPAPFLQLATGLSQGPAAAAACYSYLCNKPCLAVEYEGGVVGLRQQGQEAVLDVEEMVPWAKAPEVIGSCLPQGSRGKLMPLPEFAKPAAAGSEGGAAAGTEAFLVAWDVQADQGTGPVLLLARAAHCLQQLHAANTARQAVAGTEYWQDLKLILQLVAALLKSEPLLAKPLLAVTIVYTSSQQMDWLDVIVASLNVLPALATTATAAAAAVTGLGSGLAQIAGSGRSASANGSSSQQGQFCHEVLAAIANCLTAAAAMASCQPGRVLAALGSCQLFAGVVLVPEPLQLVALEGLAGWVQGQQDQGIGVIEDWRNLETLQALQESLELPSKSYPLTTAVIRLVQALLNQQCTWGMVPSLVSYTLHRVLGAMPWLPFSCASARWGLAASALGVVRSALTSGAVAVPGAAGPKAAGAPGGIMVTVLAAKVIHHLATAGHGYLSAVLPPPADALRDMAEQQTGSSQLLAAGSELAEQLLLLVPVLLAAVAHLSPEMPLQQYWGAHPPGGGLSPAAIIASYATYPYATHLPLLALEALNAFAILQAGPAASAAAASGLGYSVTPAPSSGGPPVPAGTGTPAGLGPLGGPVPQPYISGYHAVAAGMGAAGRGGAGGWWRPSGLFAALLAALPGLKAALLRPFELPVAQEYPEWAIRSMALLEAGVRFHPEILDSMCFPSGLSLPAVKPADASTADAAAAAGTNAPCSAPGTAAAAGKGTKGGSSSKAHNSALDGLWQLLRAAPQLMQSQPKLLAAVLRLLSVLWECQGSAHGAVELLRSQAGFWPALKACCPVPGSLPSAAAGQDDVGECEAVAWKLQAHACALHILLLELLSVQAVAGNGAAAAAGDAAAAAAAGSGGPGDGHGSLLAALGPLEVARLLAGAAELGLQQPLMDQLARFLQVAYLQLGASSVVGAWGQPTLKSDALSVAAQFRREVQPLLDAAAAGEYCLEDLRVACDLLADPDRAPGAVSGGGMAADNGADDELMEEDGAGGGGAGQRGSVLVDALYARPFGEVLLGYAAVTPWSWAAGETEYGRQFLFDSSRLCQLLGSFILESSEGTVALAITLDDVSAAASVAHARLALLQAATSLFASLSRYGPARQQLMSADVAQELLKGSVQSVDRAMSEACHLASCPASRLLSVPWGLHFIGHASSTALLLAARSMLLSVRVWKVAASSAAAAGRAGGASSGLTASGRPVLMARTLNHQAVPGSGASGSDKQASGQADSSDGDSVAITACAQCASLLSRWIRGKGGHSLAAAASAAAAAAAGASAPWDEAAGAIGGAVAADVEVVECLSTSLLLMLQALPGHQLKAAAAAAAGARTAAGSSPAAAGKQAAGAAGNSSSNMTPAELLELESALLDLLPVLCKACATAMNQQQHQQQLQLQGPSAAAAPAREAYAAALLQLLIEILQHQLPASLWLGAVSRELALVPMLTAAAARAGRSGFGMKLGVSEAAAGGGAVSNAAGAGDAGGSGTAGSSSSSAAGASAAAAAAAAAAERGAAAAAAAAAAGAAVTDISVLELTLAVAQVPEGSLQLWQQGLLPVLVSYCRHLMHTDNNSGLLDVAALGFVGPTAAGYGSAGFASALDLPGHMGVSLSTLGAYMSLSGSGSSSSVQTVKGLPGARGAAGGGAGAGAGCIWSPRHQQWCLLLGLLSTLLQQLSRSTSVEDIAMQLLVAAEPRLLTAVQLQGSHSSSSSDAHGSSHTGGLVGGLGHSSTLPSHPHGVLSLAWGPASGLGPGGLGLGFGHGPAEAPLLLTLANLLEVERSLFLLGFMVPHMGLWQMVRPGSLAAFRSAAARMVEFVAGPSLDRSLRVSCPPLSPFERRLAKLPSGLETSDGWFKVCSAGGANNIPPPAPATPTAAAAAAGAGAGPSSPAAPSGGALVIRTGGSGGCSEYCARLCEAMYTACEHSLAFLLATAPVLEPGEVAAAAAAGTWPSADALTGLQNQVLAVGTSMVQHPQTLSERRRRVAAACVRIAAAAGQLLEAVAPARWAGGPRGRGSSMDGPAEAAQRRMVSIARAAGAGL